MAERPAVVEAAGRTAAAAAETSKNTMTLLKVAEMAIKESETLDDLLRLVSESVARLTIMCDEKVGRRNTSRDNFSETRSCASQVAEGVIESEGPLSNYVRAAVEEAHGEVDAGLRVLREPFGQPAIMQDLDRRVTGIRGLLDNARELPVADLAQARLAHDHAIATEGTALHIVDLATRD